ncbi:peptidase M20 [Brevibacillus reuszeri]|uniref:Peptidase M20 n=1 Tax=Brevibacillus reuszeri TaxID=54915 RepID=A0A0K9YJR5_9BACL|nr:ArgE/DapE family deacylase [Brevibacillus reuszeri]KNB68435.1 hypothetical protein ADS79_33685 [Brevibacillus reuszeri]MED1861117.1 ArgE/DapE family deacylase [Brevibacillus reuszeri]GED72037.1 peptidase M20 [Brevibacillus reuszeri]
MKNEQVYYFEESIEALASRLIRFETTNAERVNQSAEYCCDWLRSHGVHVDVYENQGLKSVVATVGEGESTLILNGHLDVVPGQPELFHPRTVDGRLYGRGSYDMLGAVAAMMMLMAELVQAPPNCKVILALVPDEETGGELGSGFLVQQGVLGDLVICGEPTNFKIGVHAKGILQLKVEVKGKAAHGSRPWLGTNAILKAMEHYHSIVSLDVFQESTTYFKQPSINLAKIEAGKVYNQVPDLCTMGIDIRYLPGQNPEEILDQIRALLPDAEIEVPFRGVPVETKSDDKFVRKLCEVAQELAGDQAVLFGQDGSADTRFYAAKGIPAVEFGPVGANHHGPDEYVEISSLYVYKDILKKLTKNSKTKDE